jgi:hypothetical protein
LGSALVEGDVRTQQHSVVLPRPIGLEQNGGRTSATGVRALTAQVRVGTMVAKFATRASMALDRPVSSV